MQYLLIFLNVFKFLGGLCFRFILNLNYFFNRISNRLILIILLITSFLKAFIDIFGQIIKELIRYLCIEGICECHFNFIDDLTDMIIYFLDFPMRMQTIEYSTIIRFREYRVWLLIRNMRNVRER